MRKPGRKWFDLLCIGLMAGLAAWSAAHAATVPFGAEQSRFDVVLPDSWAIQYIPNGIEARENGEAVIARVMSTLVPVSTYPWKVGKDVWASGSGGMDGKPVLKAVMACTGILSL